MAGQPPPIGFELQNTNDQDAAQLNVTQINVTYPGYAPPQQEVSPTPGEQNLYPPVGNDTGGAPAPIGFEAHENAANGKGQPSETVVEVDDNQRSPKDLDDHVTDHMTTGEPSESAENGLASQDDERYLLGKAVDQMVLEADVTAEDMELIDKKAQQEINERATLYFRDGERKIDYVLAYEPGTGKNEEVKAKRRKVFEDNLRSEGLKLEYEGKETSKNQRTCFVKIHVPWRTLTKYAELTNMKMPLAENDMETELESCFEYMFNKLPSPFEIDPDLLPKETNYFTAPFNRARQEQFVIKDKDSFFTNAQRSKIVFEILSRAPYEDDENREDKASKKFGIKKLLKNQSYLAAYPLHDGRYSSEHSLLTRGADNDRHDIRDMCKRQLLYELWAKPGAWYKYQPLDQVRGYFGEKIGIYFTWLGFYTSMLIPAAIFGLIAFIYGLATFMSDPVSSEICDRDGVGNLTMCPLCDRRCPYWKLVDSCRYSQATYLFDNYATVAFSVVMALWASFFLEFWKRKQAEIEYEWDVSDFEEEEETLRPEFEASVTRKRTNPITKRDEPFVPAWSKCCRYGTTFTVLLFFLAVVLAAVFGVILYRIVIAAVLYAATDEDQIRQRTSFIASTTAACINLVVILIMNFIYQKVAFILTELEQHRTQTEWEDALTFKIFLFQFVNYYASIIYIAFFKGKFVGRPGDYNYSLINRRQEECDPAGCLIELCIQLGIVMVGKQTFNNFKEVILPKLKVWFKSRKSNKDKSEDKVYSRWEQDFNLADMPDLGLFDEYLEMVIQYGFVTIFVAAFPLAPLFALLNNIIEIRLDAYKFTTQWKRPFAARAQDIGIWFGILRGISAIAVVSNAVIIAFTSEFIPKLVYTYGYSNDTSLNGYVEFSLSNFATKDFQSSSIPDPTLDTPIKNATYCRFRGYYDGPTSPDPYAFSMAFWHILAARLAFIVVFENLVVFATWLVMYFIPDMPSAVKMQMLRENFLAKEALYHAETIQQARSKDVDDEEDINLKL